MVFAQLASGGRGNADAGRGLRVVKSIPRDKLDHALALGLRSGLGDDWLRIGSIEMFADGALGPQTAWMIKPFENSTSTGIATLDEKEMSDNVRCANAAGLSCANHAIGDRACRTVLDRDIFEIEPMEMLNTQVDAAIVSGKFMWRADSLS